MNRINPNTANPSGESYTTRNMHAGKFGSTVVNKPKDGSEQYRKDITIGTTGVFTFSSFLV